jgi:hypothetical protein
MAPGVAFSDLLAHIAMGILRMVKLFGWEKRMEVRIGDKRDEELSLLRKRQLFVIVNDTFKYVPLCTTHSTMLIRLQYSNLIPLFVMMASYSVL